MVVSHFLDYGNCEILPSWGVLPSVGVLSMPLVIGCGVVGRGFSTGRKKQDLHSHSPAKRYWGMGRWVLQWEQKKVIGLLEYFYIFVSLLCDNSYIMFSHY